MGSYNLSKTFAYPFYYFLSNVFLGLTNTFLSSPFSSGPATAVGGREYAAETSRQDLRSDG